MPLSGRRHFFGSTSISPRRGLFAAFWFVYSPHRWAVWSILGSAVVLFVIYFQVQVSVAINDWYGPFYNMIQAAASRKAADPDRGGFCISRY